MCKSNSDQRSPGPLKWPWAEHWQERRAKREVKERGPLPESWCRTGTQDTAIRCLEKGESQPAHDQAVLLHRGHSLKTRVPKDTGTQMGMAALSSLTRTGKCTRWHGQMNGKEGGPQNTEYARARQRKDLTTSLVTYVPRDDLRQCVSKKDKP